VFKEMEGPTALRRQLVQALSLSRGTIAIDAGDGTEQCRAGLVGVWNGKKGFVSVLVRQLENDRVRRWVYEDRLKDVSIFATAVQAGMAFADSLGFDMDSAEFTELDIKDQSARVDEWNALRQLSRQPREPGAAGSGSPPEPITADDHGGAVLGRLSLVKRRGFTGPLAKLLSYF
jgi:hypothetical protein